ncbi:hypothetical protein GGR32_002207 [Mesonia hippocampi]|uniref:Uncharacterized protein n=1 Tax=Mesonia hippocampi TaxID=1628250 RepID=A0A840EWF3_9FLAO|nr:hypothetical protein [Mesonia hippocampi]MBB4119896.1 hypothetical protein [Mesonia hippocampi]
MDKDKIKKYLETGADIAGGVAGGAIGLIGGPAGAILGGGLGVALTSGIKEIISRKLAERENARTAASAAFMFTGIQNNLDLGVQIRQDSFFDNTNGRSSAEELFEGVLLKCKDQYQEKKIKYISKIFEKATFDTGISSETANQILSMAESFTYRKYCVISFFAQKDVLYNTNELMKEVYSWYPNAQFSFELEILKQDIFDLVNLGIIDQNNLMMVTRNEVIPENFKLTQIGHALYDLMDLNEIPQEDLNPIFEELKYKEEFGVSEHGTRNGVKQN